VKPAPIQESYWVTERLIAGEYPRDLDDATSVAKIERLTRAGVTVFVDLTEEGELLPYDHLLLAPARAVRRQVRDLDHPSDEDMAATLDLIDAELAAGETVYVHCWGGRGRTGTVVGCWLVRHGAGGQAALARIKGLRQTPDGALNDSPETPAQREMILRWSGGA
jgi:protein tyrosine/serine phosphatase